MEVCVLSHLQSNAPLMHLPHMASMTTLLDHKTTLAYLAYLGYPDEQRTSALLTTRPRKLDRRKGKVSRNVFLCYVCGAAGSGKTSLLRSFAGKPFREVYEPTSKMVSVVNAVDIDGSEKYLVVRSYRHLERG
jgi:Ras family protein T1